MIPGDEILGRRVTRRVAMDSTGRTSLDEFVKRLRELVADNVAGSTQLMTRFNEFVREASQAASTGRAGDRTDAQAILSRLLDFHLASYQVVSAQSLAVLNGLLSAAESTLLPKAAPAPDVRATPAPRAELKLSGRPGERPTTGFVIENHFDRAASVTFESTELIPTTGPALPSSVVSFEPATLVIAPRRQVVVQAAVAITTDFVVGQTYTTTIRLRGFEAKEVGLSVTVLPPAEAASPPSPSPKPPKPAKKRRSRGTK
jgi:hypothetical protein